MRPVETPIICVCLNLPLQLQPQLALQARLQNPHAVCYMNACVQAYTWIGDLATTPAHCHGRLQAAVKLLRKPLKPYLPSCLPWVPLLRQWISLRMQHDAAEFMLHLVNYAEPSAYIGQWQARTENPPQVEETGPLSAPILLDLPGGSLQGLVDNWCHQAAIHALQCHSGIVQLQLKRYRNALGVTHKCSDPIAILPGDSLILPVFADSASTTLSHRQFRVAYVIFHHGQTTTSGHYQTALSVPTGPTADSEWQFYICDDGKMPRRAASADLRDIKHNAYLVGLIRGDVSMRL